MWYSCEECIVQWVTGISRIQLHWDSIEYLPFLSRLFHTLYWNSSDLSYMSTLPLHRRFASRSILWFCWPLKGKIGHSSWSPPALQTWHMRLRELEEFSSSWMTSLLSFDFRKLPLLCFVSPVWNRQHSHGRNFSVLSVFFIPSFWEWKIKKKRRTIWFLIPHSTSNSPRVPKFLSFQDSITPYRYITVGLRTAVLYVRVRILRDPIPAIRPRAKIFN